MKRFIELKHVGPKAHVRTLIDELIDRVEAKLQGVSGEATSVHVLFEENGSHKLYHTSLSCHVPGHLLAAHEEGRDAGATIRQAFEELERQLDKCHAILRHERSRRQLAKTQRVQKPSTITAWTDDVS